MKKFTYFLLSLSAAIIFFSCSSVDSKDPKSVVKAFYESLAKQDIEGASKYASTESKQTLDMMKKAFEAAKQMPGVQDSLEKNDPTAEFKNVVFGETKIEGDKATVEVSSTKFPEQGKVKMPLVKQNGEWKVDFSMATLMSMGKDAMKAEGTSTDSIKHEMDAAIENMNMDSLSTQLQNSLDSLK